jgi:fucose 4-O-acetylase-like acetyltransferase
MPSELWGSLVTIVLIVLTFVFPRARVLTIPFFFVFVIILIFWSARRHAERLDAEEER